MRWFQVFAIALLLSVAACNKATQEKPKALTPVRASTITLGPAAPTIRTAGVLVSKGEMRLSFKVSGIVKHIAVRDGQRVKRGEVLAAIDHTEIDAQVEQARQAADKAERDAVRGEKLYANKLISLSQLQDMRTQVAVIKAALDTAQFNRNYAVIAAPEDGVVLRHLAQERELVAVGTPIFIFAGFQRGYVVRMGLSDRDVMQVRLGDRAEVKMDAYTDQVFNAQVSEISGVADERSGLFMVELHLMPSQVPLTDGLLAKLELHPYTAGQGTRAYVPIASIVEGLGDRANVYVLSKDTSGGDVVRRKEVQIAFIEGERVALVQGVTPGERVVTDGSLYVLDNERVAVQTAE